MLGTITIQLRELREATQICRETNQICHSERRLKEITDIENRDARPTPQNADLAPPHSVKLKKPATPIFITQIMPKRKKE